jgi:uncharacterized protein YciI
MASITDSHMREMLGRSKLYTVVVLRRTGRRADAAADAVVWEHGRRNFELRAKGVLRIVGPMVRDADFAGLCIFSTGVDETRKIMDEDPSVKAGIFTYETHVMRSFPGDSLS